ncbi:MAG: prephenate dehydrogenase/arogenate dehydrogenase family protein [Chloroflexi bacterium]|nr:prephenate dehydrogenase/arogenate dehydrogenase family protein [Chloroflexota bacterium]MCI0866816.1 prephenate dehydrogenase/arogenate dehydrogenase family protein [Chloroflexota bacterium]
MAKLSIIGTGLIGTSLALALKKAQLKDVEVVGTDSSSSARSGAQKSGAFDRIEGRLMSVVRDADIVILATPVMAMRELMEIIGPELPEGCLVTDVGSSKKVVLEWADQYLPKTVDFVGGHPMAGKETAGPEHADANLFRDKSYCIVPSPNARQKAVSEVTTLVETVGARPFYIGVDEHDSFVAAVSHLPFLLSVALVGCTSKSANWEDIAQLAASGYHDISRLASGDPVMHRDICVSNPEPIVAWIDSMIRELYDIRNVLNAEGGPDSDAVHQFFSDASEARARWMAGAVVSKGRQASAGSEIPSFAESMGEMFAGRRVMEAQKKMFSGLRDRGRNRD